MDKINFYIPESESIPTKLRLLIKKEDGKDIAINYQRLQESFGYNFELYNIISEEEAEEIIKEIANKMCLQSYDHGQEWRMEGIEKLGCEINYAIQRAEYNVIFRIKDSY